MTIEEAIRILDPETTAEALAEIEYYAGFSGHTAKVQACSDACEVAVAALREKAEREKNEPLTLDELRKMKDEPVWVQSPGVPEYGRWAIVAGVDTTDGEKTLYLHNDFTCREYGRVWLAYRHKPKEE